MTIDARVRLRVEASGVNRADLLQLAGDYSPPPGESSIPGLECAGVVVHDPTERWAPGTRVAALLGSGGYGLEVDVDAALLLPADGIEPLEAAVLPEALCTIWWNLVTLANAQPGESVLITGANSGVGHLAVQVARELGLRAIASTRGDRWTPQLLALGAAGVVDASVADGANQITALAPDGVDIVLDLTGGTAPGILPDLIGRRGRWLIIGLLGGEKAEIDLRNVIRRRLTITGSSLRSLTLDERRTVVAGVTRELWPAVLDGRLRAHIAATFPLDESAAAHAYLAAGGVFGKLAIFPTEPTQEQNS